MKIHPGDLVLGTAGREKNKILVVLSKQSSQYVLICDGKNRPLAKPKKKNIKHLCSLNNSLESMKEKLEKDVKMSNSEIRKALYAAKVRLGLEKQE